MHIKTLLGGLSLAVLSTVMSGNNIIAGQMSAFYHYLYTIIAHDVTVNWLAYVSNAFCVFYVIICVTRMNRPGGNTETKTKPTQRRDHSNNTEDAPRSRNLRKFIVTSRRESHNEESPQVRKPGRDKTRCDNILETTGSSFDKKGSARELITSAHLSQCSLSCAKIDKTQASVEEKDVAIEVHGKLSRTDPDVITSNSAKNSGCKINDLDSSGVSSSSFINAGDADSKSSLSSSVVNAKTLQSKDSAISLDVSGKKEDELKDVTDAAFSSAEKISDSLHQTIDVKPIEHGNQNAKQTKDLVAVEKKNEYHAPIDCHSNTDGRADKVRDIIFQNPVQEDCSNHKVKEIAISESAKGNEGSTTEENEDATFFESVKKFLKDIVQEIVEDERKDGTDSPNKNQVSDIIPQDDQEEDLSKEDDINVTWPNTLIQELLADSAQNQYPCKVTGASTHQGKEQETLKSEELTPPLYRVSFLDVDYSNTVTKIQEDAKESIEDCKRSSQERNASEVDGDTINESPQMDMERESSLSNLCINYSDVSFGILSSMPSLDDLIQENPSSKEKLCCLEKENCSLQCGEDKKASTLATSFEDEDASTVARDGTFRSDPEERNLETHTNSTSTRISFSFCSSLPSLEDIDLHLEMTNNDGDESDLDNGSISHIEENISCTKSLETTADDGDISHSVTDDSSEFDCDMEDLERLHLIFDLETVQKELMRKPRTEDEDSSLSPSFSLSSFEEEVYAGHVTATSELTNENQRLLNSSRHVVAIRLFKPLGTKELMLSVGSLDQDTGEFTSVGEQWTLGRREQMEMFLSIDSTPQLSPQQYSGSYTLALDGTYDSTCSVNNSTFFSFATSMAYATGDGDVENDVMTTFSDVDAALQAPTDDLRASDQLPTDQDPVVYIENQRVMKDGETFLSLEDLDIIRAATVRKEFLIMPGLSGETQEGRSSCPEGEEEGRCPSNVDKGVLNFFATHLILSSGRKFSLHWFNRNRNKVFVAAGSLGLAGYFVYKLFR